MDILLLIGEWVREHGLTVFAVLFGAIIVNRFSAYFITRIIRRVVTSSHTGNDTMAEKKREDTLIRIFTKTAHILVWLIAFMMVLSGLGVEIAPLLAAAGVAGIALGFGGQYLIRDLISGAFIIMENQYRVGDVACVGGTCGLVEDISMRMTTLRDLDGTVHHIPHGEITQVSNMSKGFTRVNLNIGVSYDSDMERVEEIVNSIGIAMAEDEIWKEMIISAPKYLRIDDFADSAIVIKILGDTVPLKQWEVAGELRKRIKIAFDKEGIVIPFPQRDVHVQESAGKKGK